MTRQKTLLDTEKYSSGMMLIAVLVKSIDFRKSGKWETKMRKALRSKEK